MKQKIVTFASCASVVLASALSLVFILSTNFAKAYTSPGKPTGYVNDLANIIDDSEQQILEADLANFYATSSNQIVVATIQNLGGDSVDNYANELFREWGVGTKEKNNGVLLLVAVEDRKMRIEVGYGLEGAITDLESGRIVDNTLTPAFRAGDYTGGIKAAIANLKEAASGEFNNAIVKTSSDSNSLFDIAFYGFFVFVWLSSFLARSKSIWAGAIVGAVVGISGAIFIDDYFLKAFIVVLGPLFGLGLDWLVSRNYKASVARGGSGGFFNTWGGFKGGGGSSGGGGFGGFSGGSSGGGGSSGSW